MTIQICVEYLTVNINPKPSDSFNWEILSNKCAISEFQPWSDVL